MKTTIYILLIILFVSSIQAQDTHFSMFYKSPVMLNPANTGNFDGKWRAVTNYRKQGDFVYNPYSTNVLTIDAPVFIWNKTGGLGITAVNDRTDDNTLNTSSIQVTTSQFIKLSQNSFLHTGFGFAVANKSINMNSLTFPSQFDNSTGFFNPNFQNNEKFQTYNKWYVDLSVGVMWSYVFSKTKFQIGAAMFHYNQPKLDFVSDELRLKPKYQIHAYLEKEISNNLFIKPRILYTTTSKASETLLGTDFGVNFENEFFKKIYLGIYCRGGIKRIFDATIFNLGFAYKHFNFNFNYDYAINVFSSENYNDMTFEIAVKYTFPRLTVNKRAIQCEIF